jgi:signal transduction histidine kinase
VAEVLRAESLTDAALLAAVLALGTAVRHRRAWAEEVRERLDHAERERRREAERRAQEERLHIARELHDVVAHTIVGLNVQAGVAADVIDDDPRQAKAALSAIRRQAREAVAELRATIGLLRGRGSPEPERAPAPGLADLDALVSTTAAAGVETSVSIVGTPRELPSATDLTAYRIVQESLTNVVRHADASTATVLLRYEPDTVVVHVDDDGHRIPNGAGGHGIVGMRERAAAIGGTLAAGPHPKGGFRVCARLPTRGE